jgi:hypothetical protein
MTPWGLIFGFAGSLISHVFDIWKIRQENQWKLKFDEADKKHEVALMGLQIEQQKMKISGKLEEINIGNDYKLNEIVYRDRDVKSKWARVASEFVRPVTVYTVLAVWVICKMIQYAWLKEIDTSFAIIEIWGVQDWFLLETVLGYYVGTRGITAANSSNKGAV